MNNFFQLASTGFHLSSWLALQARRVRHALAERHQRAIAYRDLKSLDAYQLRDIGLSHRAVAQFPSELGDKCCNVIKALA